MPVYAHLLQQPDPAHRQFLQGQLHPDIALSWDESIPEQTTILVGGRPTTAQIDACPNLEAVIIPYAGLPATTRQIMAERSHIAIHNLHHNAIPTAEMALTLLLTAAKRTIPADRLFRMHDWSARHSADYSSFILEGKIALILGYGAVGQHVARTCQALGMRVLATKRALPSSPNRDGVQLHPPSDLSGLLPQADVLLITLPLTAETKDMIRATELALLPTPAILVNIGRAEIVDEAALYQALQAGTLHAAGLDVWYQYPSGPEARSNTPPSQFPFHELDNVVMSPHRAGGGGTDEVERRRMTALARSLNAAAQGQPIPHQVDLARGY